MKKFFAILVSMVVLASNATVMADVPDISGLTDEEIIELNSLVNQAIVDRNINKSAELLRGRYLVGKDIPAGSYTVYCKYDKDSWWAEFDQYADETEEETISVHRVFGPEEEDIDKGILAIEDTWHVTLFEGNVISVSEPMTLTIYNGVVFQ